MRTNVKAWAALVYALLAVGAASASAPAGVATQARPADSVARAGALPAAALVDDLDRVMQLRFLRSPGFGMNRMGTPLNPHLREFVPQTKEELRVVTDLQSEGWKVGVYLIGRRAYERLVGKDADAKKQLYVEYRLNRPLPLTAHTKGRELPAPKRLRGEAAEALYRFQEINSHTFAAGKWSYVARPVRANESCLQCHRDMFVTKKTGMNTYTYRRRLAGDPIGVLVYAFARPD